MVKAMNLRMHINKRGSYLLEAAISLPVFIIAVMVMNSVILMYACIEDCAFIAAAEMRRGATEAVIADTSVVVPYRIKKEITDISKINAAYLKDIMNVDPKLADAAAKSIQKGFEKGERADGRKTFGEVVSSLVKREKQKVREESVEKTRAVFDEKGKASETISLNKDRKSVV